MRTAALTSLLVIALPRAQALLLPRAHALAPRLVRVRALTTLAVETAPQRTEAEEGGQRQRISHCKVCACAALQSDSVIYDIGSGYGRLATYLFLKERAREVKGIEINEGSRLEAVAERLAAKPGFGGSQPINILR